MATAYPGTPSTEILENLAQFDGVSAQWSPNEKVALEVAIGASLGGARALAAMKHVGVNVAADPLMTLAYTGVNGGLALVTADDPGIHSSQNEQDNRWFGRFARVPVLEPSDSQEAKDFVGVALELSEELDTVVLLRTTTRTSHARSLVTLGERAPRELRPYTKDIRKNLMIPGHARMRQPEVLARFERMAAWAETTPINRMEWRDRRLGIVTSGICYQYVREARPDASVLKLGAVYPLPLELVRRFADSVHRLVVVEELEPFIEEALKAAGLPVVSLGMPRIGERTPSIVAAALARALGEPVPPPAPVPEPAVPARPPVLCPGCPHRAVFYVLRKLRLRVMGDIGCYTLGALQPLDGMDAFMCMGASIGMALGMEKADPASARKTVAVIGDSTFFHSGMTALLDMVYNRSAGTVLILDNGTTAMTGHQDHPGTGRTAEGAEAPQADLGAVCRAIGVRHVVTVDPYDLPALEAAVRAETAAPEVSVVIAQRPCALLERTAAEPAELVADLCRGCKLCMRLGCPAMSWDDKVPRIDTSLCGGCGLCGSVCPFDALRFGEAGDD